MRVLLIALVILTWALAIHAASQVPSERVLTGTNSTGITTGTIIREESISMGAAIGTAPKAEGPDWAKWFGNLVSVINLGFVCWMAWFTTKTQRRYRESDLKRGVALFWVQDLVLKANVEFLHQFFEKYEKEIEGMLKAGAAQQPNLAESAALKITAFKEDYHQVRRKIVEPLIMISNDFKGLQKILSQIEDTVTEEYQRIPGLQKANGGKIKKDALDSFRDLRKKFLDQIHAAQMKVVTGSNGSKACGPLAGCA